MNDLDLEMDARAGALKLCKELPGIPFDEALPITRLWRQQRFDEATLLLFGTAAYCQLILNRQPEED